MLSCMISVTEPKEKREASLYKEINWKIRVFFFFLLVFFFLIFFFIKGAGYLKTIPNLYVLHNQ